MTPPAPTFRERSAAADGDPIRYRLAGLIERDGEDMAGLSRVIGRPAGFLGAYLRRGTPKVLPERERELLASYFRVHPADLLPRTLREARAEQMRKHETVALPTDTTVRRRHGI